MPAATENPNKPAPDPPAPPTPPYTGGPDGTFSPQDVRSIAILQKIVIISVLLYLIAIASQCLLAGSTREIVNLIEFAFSVLASVFVFLLTLKIHGSVMGTFLTLLTIIPVVGLGVLLLVNSHATDILKRHGVTIGIFGAKKLPP